MKKILILIVVIGFSYVVNAQQPVHIQVANHIANKMRDTLGLSPNQRARVFAINIQLYNQKSTVRQQHTSPDSIRKYMQKVENKRDSLYHIVFEGLVYTQYLQKKSYLVSAY